jgi:phage replication-related protein YjqB (UPF0714/DUF867 family)
MSLQDCYHGFAELARHAREGWDYRRVVEGRGGEIAIVAPHGGGIEPGTSEIARGLAGREIARGLAGREIARGLAGREIARALAGREIAREVAGREFGLYCFEGLRPEGNDKLHIASHRFDEPRGVRLVARARVVVAVHGCAGARQAIYVGGLDRHLRERLIAVLRQAGFEAERATGDLAGCYASNICNRGRSGRGVQLEITGGLRLVMFKGMKWHERQITTPVFDAFVDTVRGVLV